MSKKEVCTDCQKLKVIILKFSATANGKTIQTRLCRQCLKKTARK